MPSYNYIPTVSSSNTTTTNAPGGPQAGALNTIYGGLSDAYSKSNAMGPYQGNFYSGINPYLSGAYDQAGNFAQGPAAGVGNTQINTGQGLLNQGYGGAGGAMSGLLNFGNTNQTQNNINTANAYANNPYIDQAVNAATYGANRNAAENDIPNLYRSAAASGNINSDRTALAQGVVERGLAENKQNIGASMRYNQFNNGLNTALTQNQQQLGALSNAGSLGANIGGAGSGMMSQGINDQANLSRLYESAGLGVQGQADRGLANDYQKYQTQYQFPWQNLQNYYGIAGNNNWWGSQNQSGTSFGMQPVANNNPGALSYLGAGLGVAGALAGTAVGGPAGGTLGGMAAGALGSGLSQLGSSGSLYPSFPSSWSQPNMGGAR